MNKACFALLLIFWLTVPGHGQISKIKKDIRALYTDVSGFVDGLLLPGAGSINDIISHNVINNIHSHIKDTKNFWRWLHNREKWNSYSEVYSGVLFLKKRIEFYNDFSGNTTPAFSSLTNGNFCSTISLPEYLDEITSALNRKLGPSPWKNIEIKPHPTNHQWLFFHTSLGKDNLIRYQQLYDMECNYFNLTNDNLCALNSNIELYSTEHLTRMDAAFKRQLLNDVLEASQMLLKSLAESGAKLD